MQVQVLDCDYTLLNGKPLIRIFGKTIDGESICVFYDKFLPYFYLDADENFFDAVTKDLKERFGSRTEIVEKTLPTGYQKSKKVLKIIGKDPSKTPEIREYVRKYGVPYEADVLFRYRFMIDFGIRGMSWIEVRGKPATTQSVFTRAINADYIKPIEFLENAPTKYMAFDIECVSKGDRIPEPGKDPIIMISCSFSPAYKGKKNLIVVSKYCPRDADVECCENEEAMLRKFLSIVKEYDPDFVIGYNINNFDIPYVLDRMDKFNIPRLLGRCVKYSSYRKSMGVTIPYVTGRVVVDPYDILRRDPWVSFRRYNLATVAKEMLGIEKLDIGGPKEMIKLWKAGGGNVKKIIDYCRRDSELALKLVLDKGLLEKFVELSKVSGVVLQDTFGGQTQRLDVRIMHEFSKNGYIMPCRPEKGEMFKRSKERANAGLKGALVLEPETGLHSNGSVLVLDFTSLYPSIIRTFNLCPTTLTHDESLPHRKTPYGAMFVNKEVREGILPKIVNEFLDARIQVKQQLKFEKDPERKRILNARQLALKTMANSLYGYTGYTRSRLYIIDVAASITSIGRENITRTKNLIETKYGYNIIYGDTDSIFVKTDITDLDAAQKLGEEISSYVTENLSGLELKFEKTFKTFLILAKKRYAGWSFEKTPFGWKDTIGMKGIETVRRDWCPMVSETMSSVLEIILQEGDIPKASMYVRDVIKDIIDRKISLEKLTIVKGVTKPLEDYDGIQPHVELAKKIRKRDPSRGNFVGERLGYVIIRGNQMLSKRAEDPAYVKEKKLQTDIYYYIENQLLPPLERIFDACGISRSELKEGSRQQNLFDAIGGKAKTPAQTVLDSYECIACQKCDWTSSGPTLTGKCPKCEGKLYFKKGATLGKFVKI